jgi:hypothetical protein
VGYISGLALKHVVGFPHDLLKPLNWKKHEDPRILPENVRQAISKYKTEYIQPDGSVGYVTLEQVIEGHGHTNSFWERIWHEADRLSAAVARLRLEYDYWHDGQAEPFFIPVYGDFKIYDGKKRREICDKIFQVLQQYAEDANKHEEALRQLMNSSKVSTRQPKYAPFNDGCPEEKAFTTREMLEKNED